MKKQTLLAFIIIVPLLCDCTQAQPVNSGPFEYKEIYMPDAMGLQAKKMGMNSVDEDWGIWGHNLKVVIPRKPSLLAYASVNGQRTKDQFCFSSERLYTYIEHYIENNYGEKDTYRFAILPNDNDLVCMCDQCQKAGNGKEDSSPAVFNMIERLAKRFPMHQFFTSHYRTTKGLPDHEMPSNTGALVSAIHYQLWPVPHQLDTTFANLLKQWSEKANHVYVWDYISNFDDYFTPFAVLKAMQRRLQIYQHTGANGVFMNGSGTDYSSLGQLRTVVLADLMRDPNQELEPLVRKHCEQLYPVAGKTIADFVLLQEEWTVNRGKRLPIYGGVKEAMNTYLPAQEFKAFYKELTNLLPQTIGKEKAEVQRMCRAMAMTQLELMRIEGNVEGYRPLLERLTALAEDGTKIYSESCWGVDEYVNDYRVMAEHYEESRKNLLLRQKLVPLTSLDEEYSDISMLTDGMLGLESNYHCGHLISSATPALKISIPRIGGMKKIRVWLNNNVLFHIMLPKKLTLTAGGRVVAEAVPAVDPMHPEQTYVDLPVPAGAKGTLVLSIFRNTKDRTMAIDEIEGY